MADQSWWQKLADKVKLTEVSKQTNSNTGPGIVGLNFKRSLPMGKLPSIIQAKIYDILICACEFLRRNSSGLRLFVIPDIQAALRAHFSLEWKSKVATYLNDLKKHNKFTLYWIPFFANMGNCTQ